MTILWYHWHSSYSDYISCTDQMQWWDIMSIRTVGTLTGYGVEPLSMVSFYRKRCWSFWIKGSFCVCTQPMRDVTLQRRLSMAGCIHKMIPVNLYHTAEAFSKLLPNWLHIILFNSLSSKMYHHCLLTHYHQQAPTYPETYSDWVL